MWDKSLNVMRKTTERRMEEIGKKNIHFQSGKWPPVWDANLRGPREDPRWEAPWVEEGGDGICLHVLWNKTTRGWAHSWQHHLISKSNKGGLMAADEVRISVHYL